MPLTLKLALGGETRRTALASTELLTFDLLVDTARAFWPQQLAGAAGRIQFRYVSALAEWSVAFPRRAVRRGG